MRWDPVLCGLQEIHGNSLLRWCPRYYVGDGKSRVNPNGLGKRVGAFCLTLEL